MVAASEFVIFCGVGEHERGIDRQTFSAYVSISILYCAYSRLLVHVVFSILKLYLYLRKHHCIHDAQGRRKKRVRTNCIYSIFSWDLQTKGTLVKLDFPRAVVSAGLVLRTSLAEWNVFEFMRTTFDALSSIGAIVVTVTVAYKKGIFVGEHTTSCMIVKLII